MLKSRMEALDHAKRGHAMASSLFYEQLSRREEELWLEIRKLAEVPSDRKASTLQINWDSGEVTELTRSK